MASSSSAAASFAPYQPPPDEAQQQQQRYQPSPAVAPPSPPPAQRYTDDDPYDDDPRYATESYQAGSWQNQQQHQHQQHQAQTGFGSQQQQQQSLSSAGPAWGSGVQPDAGSFVTSQGVSISNLCFMAWALPPFSGVFVLIFETTNDLARFHAYQSSLCGVAGILFLYILRSWFGWYTLSIIFGMGALGASWVAGSNAHRAAPTLGKEPYLPYVGPLAEEWVGSE